MAKSGFAKEHLSSFIERIERLEEERNALTADIREVYSEAKGTGFDTKIMRQVVRMRKLDKADFQEQEAMLDLYLNALGMRARQVQPAGVARFVCLATPSPQLRLRRFQAEFLELAVERRAADAEPARHFRHVAVIAADRHADDFGFHLLEFADMAGGIGDVERVRR